MLDKEHYNFLRLFLQEQDLRFVVLWNRGMPSSKVRKFAEEFLSKGYLEEATVQEMASRFLTAAELRALAAKHGKPTTGTKYELVTRFVDEPKVLAAALRGRRVLRLTEDGMRALEGTEQSHEAMRHMAMLESFDILAAGDFVKARERVVTYVHSDANVRGENYISGGIDGPEHIEFAMSARPPSIEDDRVLFEARATLGMDALWGNLDWRSVVAERLSSTPETLERAMNHLLRSATYKHELDDAKRIEDGPLLYSIRFDRRDAVSCDLCRELQTDRKMLLEEFPSVPLSGCKSSEGCQFELSVAALDIDEEVDEAAASELRNVHELPYRQRQEQMVPGRLRRLKELFEMELITREDYEAKKRDILEDL